ncbi:hypothetical protein U1Q18_037951 [Sarracenia purpurea var. burkii]
MNELKGRPLPDLNLTPEPEIPPEPGMPQGAPGHEIQHPAPPEIPRLLQPLINDHDRFIGWRRFPLGQTILVRTRAWCFQGQPF